MKKVIFAIFAMFYLCSRTLLGQQPDFVWVKNFTSSSASQGISIKVDSLGNVYSTGVFNGIIDLDPSLGTYTLASNGDYDVFISKVDINGNFIWGKSLGGKKKDAVNDLVLDATGNIYIAGSFQDTVDFNPGSATYTLASDGFSDIFISKLDGTGNFLWTKSIGDHTDQFVRAIKTDKSGNIYVTGDFMGLNVDFDPGATTYTLSSGGLSNPYILKLNATGNFMWARGITGSLAIPYDLDLNSAGNVCLVGTLYGTSNYVPSLSTYTINSSGGNNSGFIAQWDSLGNFMWGKTLRGLTTNDASSCSCIDFSPDDKIFISGFHQGAIDFDPGNGVTVKSTLSPVYQDVFILKLDLLGNFIWVNTIIQSSLSASFGQRNQINHKVSDDGNIYATGAFQGTYDFDPGIGTNYLINTGASSVSDVFMFKWDTLGTFKWAFKMGNASSAVANDIDLDSNGTLYTTGSFKGTVDFDPGANVFNLSSGGTFENGFIHKMKKKDLNPVGLNEDFLQENIMLYPNPTHDYVEVFLRGKHSSNITIQLLDAIGVILMQKEVSKEFKIDLTELPNGIYYLKSLEKGTLIKTTILIKQ